MQKSWIIVIGLAAGIVMLVLLGRSRNDEPVIERVVTREQFGSSGQVGAGENRGAGSGESRGDGTRGNGERPRAGSSSDNAEHGRGGLARNENGSRPRSDGGEGSARYGGGAARPLERAARTTDAPLRPPDLPSGTGRGEHAPGDGSDATDQEPAPDMAYDAGDKVFDTGKKTELSDASIASANVGSVAFWVEPQWSENSGDGATFVQFGEDGLRLVKQGDKLALEYNDGSGTVQAGSADISEWQSGDWRHVVAIWKDGSLALYIDGGQLFLNSPGRPLSSPVGAAVYVGSDPANGGSIAPAQVSNLTIWNRDLAAGEIRQLFESGGQPVQLTAPGR